MSTYYFTAELREYIYENQLMDPKSRFASLSADPAQIIQYMLKVNNAYTIANGNMIKLPIDYR